MATKRVAQATKPISQSSVVTIGLDIGYGVVKGMTTSDIVMFPSVCGHARELKYQAEEIAAKHPGDQIRDDEGSWFVGELALSQLLPGELLRLRGRTANEAVIGNVFRTRLAKVAIGKLLSNTRKGDVVHVRIASGLPVDHMRDAAELKAALVGQHLIRTDACEFIVNVADVIIMPQPYGCIFANTLTPAGEVNPCHTYTRTGVCDVGTYTVDIALDDDGEYVDAESGSVESGVYTAQERIATLLEDTSRQKMPFKMVDSVLRTGLFRARGEVVDYSDAVHEALEPLRSATLNLMGEKWKTGSTVDVIYLSGGGAGLVKDVLTSFYKQARVVEDAQLANARGYLNYALFRSQG
jgi:plasmid segregation protein ParM